MMKATLLQIIFIFSLIGLRAQNTGINTTDPGSTLSVSGSMSAGYNNVTTNYTLTGNDYFVAYSGTGNATFTLPAALATGSGNFKGRIYKIKNNSNYKLTVDAAGTEKINTDDMVLVTSQTTLEFISTGLTSGSTWDIVSNVSPDGIRRIIEATGCASCTGYDQAATNSWVQITNNEYVTLLSSLFGMGSYGAPTSVMSTAAAAGFGGATTVTQNFTTMSQMPANSYPVAMSVKTSISAPAGFSGLTLKLSNTGQSSGYATIGSGLPAVAAPAAQTIYYFVLKRPILTSPVGASSNMAIYQPVTYQLGTISAATNLFYGAGDNSAPNNSINSTPLFQVLATPVKSW